MITHIHHINFLVNDLEQATAKYQTLLGCDKHDFIRDELKARDVKIARVLLGQTWLVLVQPVGDQGIPAKHLREHGEGFFLLSLGCHNLDSEMQRITSQSNLRFSTPERAGLDNWLVRDLTSNMSGDVQLQLTQEGNTQGEGHQE